MSSLSRLSLRLLEKLGTIGRFLVSGGTAALVLLVILYISTDVFHIWYLASSVIAFACAFLTSFTLHKFWTFRDRHVGRLPKQVASHLVVGGINLLLNTAFLFVLVEYVRIHYLLSQILVSGSLAVASFFIYKHFIFHRGAAGANPEG